MLRTTILFLTVLLITEGFAYSGSFGDEDNIDVDWSVYHTTDEINDEIMELERQCDGKLKRTKILNRPEIELVEISENNDRDSAKYNVFLLFGEHAREMISPETGLNIAKALCGKAETTVDVEDNLHKFNYHMVLNANPASRKKVEAGEYCLRVNENGVDLNRNWDDHWKKAGHPNDDTFSGVRPNSEPEVVAVKNEIDRIKPEVFITVHSGTNGMYTPYAYSVEEAEYNENQMLDVLNKIDEKYCNCPSGAAGNEVGYLCPGTCLDYAYDKTQSKYSFAFEIWKKPNQWSFFQKGKGKE